MGIKCVLNNDDDVNTNPRAIVDYKSPIMDDPNDYIIKAFPLEVGDTLSFIIWVKTYSTLSQKITEGNARHIIINKVD
jgi:hypothetical protein